MRGTDTILHLDCAGARPVTRVDTPGGKEPGEHCRVFLPPEHVHLFEPDSGERIA